MIIEEGDYIIMKSYPTYYNSWLIEIGLSIGGIYKFIRIIDGYTSIIEVNGVEVEIDVDFLDSYFDKFNRMNNLDILLT